MKHWAVAELVSTYLRARHAHRDLTAREAAGFLVTQLGVVEAIQRIKEQGLNAKSEYWRDILTNLIDTI